MELKTKLTEWRSRKNYSRETAAGRIGVSLTTYIRWEKGIGKRGPNGITLKAIEKELAQ